MIKNKIPISMLLNEIGVNTKAQEKETSRLSIVS